MKVKKFDEYKRDLAREQAYKYATQIQENFALAIHGAPDDEKQYEGHISVMDVMNKIDAMVKMFEKTIVKNPTDKSAQKIVDVVESLYDLASAKLHEAKKQCSSYMKKASGVTAPSKPKPVMPDMGMGMGPDAGMDSEEPDMGGEPEMDGAGAPPPPAGPKPLPKFTPAPPAGAAPAPPAPDEDI